MRRHRRRYLRLTAPPRKYNGAVARRLRERANRNVLPLSRDQHYYGRALRFINELTDFSRRLKASESVHAGGTVMQYRSPQELLADKEMIELYITALTDKPDCAMSVPGEARRFLSAARERLGLTSIVDTTGTINDVVTGHKRRTPKQKKQAESVHEDDVREIVQKYGCSKDWWEVQIACIMAVGFVALQRLGELSRVVLEGVKFILRDGTPISAATASKLPRLSKVRGAFIHIDWTKADQVHDAWIAVACRATLRVLWRHVAMLRREGHKGGPLFPSRQYRGGPRSEINAISGDSARSAFRKALRTVCGYSKEYTDLVGGHSLRVGGSNFCRRLGIDHEVHRLLGGWAVLNSSLSYYRLTAEEQFAMTDSLSLGPRTNPSGGNGTTPVDLAQVMGVQLSG